MAFYFNFFFDYYYGVCWCFCFVLFFLSDLLLGRGLLGVSLIRKVLLISFSVVPLFLARAFISCMRLDCSFIYSFSFKILIVGVFRCCLLFVGFCLGLVSCRLA